jgi:ABC-type transport system involved in multi-copper enzyme maturation permease subunit
MADITFVFIALCLAIIAIAILLPLWISAIVSTLSNQNVKQENKIWWFLLVLLVPIIGQCIFFFAYRFKKRALATVISIIIGILIIPCLYISYKYNEYLNAAPNESTALDYSMNDKLDEIRKAFPGVH